MSQPPKNPYGRRGQTGQIVTRHSPRNRSGCIGVYRDQRRYVFADGSVVVRWWWRARMGERRRSFPCGRMGEREAFHAAVRQRTEWEREAARAARSRRLAASRARYAADREVFVARAREYREKKRGIAALNPEVSHAS